MAVEYFGEDGEAAAARDAARPRATREAVEASENAYVTLGNVIAKKAYGKPFDELNEAQQDAVDKAMLKVAPSLGNYSEQESLWNDGQIPDDYKKALKNPPSVTPEPQSKSTSGQAASTTAQEPGSDRKTPDWAKDIEVVWQGSKPSPEIQQPVVPARPQAEQTNVAIWDWLPPGIQSIVSMFTAAFGDNPQQSVAASQHQGLSSDVLDQVAGIGQAARSGGRISDMTSADTVRLASVVNNISKSVERMFD